MSSMSFMMVDRLPVPKLSTYISATVLSISAATYYSVKYSIDASQDSNAAVQADDDPTKTDPMDVYYEQMLNVLAFMLQDPLCFLVSRTFVVLVCLKENLPCARHRFHNIIMIIWIVVIVIDLDDLNDSMYLCIIVVNNLLLHSDIAVA